MSQVNQDGSPNESHFNSAYKRAKFLHEYIINNNFKNFYQTNPSLKEFWT